MNPARQSRNQINKEIRKTGKKMAKLRKEFSSVPFNSRGRLFFPAFLFSLC